MMSCVDGWVVGMSYNEEYSLPMSRIDACIDVMSNTGVRVVSNIVQYVVVMSNCMCNKKNYFFLHLFVVRSNSNGCSSLMRNIYIYHL